MLDNFSAVFLSSQQPNRILCRKLCFVNLVGLESSVIVDILSEEVTLRGVIFAKTFSDAEYNFARFDSF